MYTKRDNVFNFCSSSHKRPHFENFKVELTQQLVILNFLYINIWISTYVKKKKVVCHSGYYVWIHYGRQIALKLFLLRLLIKVVFLLVVDFQCNQCQHQIFIKIFYLFRSDHQNLIQIERIVEKINI